ncbi:MAG TPA: alpha-L-fucosidase [Lentimicrobium sp.]|nr:alpha-L-fucosidase [Lentimicrobium sp.]
MKYFLFPIFITLMSFSSLAQDNEDEKYIPETDPLVLKNLEHWQDVKFGLLMHWGAYSQWGIVESWSICPEDEGWCVRNDPDYNSYISKYEALKTTFNPVKFDPVPWAKAAKEAGMKYVIFTTKHHDGFSMFDTKYSDYKITDKGCPFSVNPKANVAKEIFNAFRNEGFMTGCYFSKPDWHNDDYWWPNFPPRDRNVNYDPEVYPEKWEAYTQFTHNQILELMSEYGKMDILWLDGGWVCKIPKDELKEYYSGRIERMSTGYMKNNIISQDIRMDELVEKCRQLQPGLIVVDRAVYGKNQNYLTPENRVPEKTLPYPWESCIISGGGWAHTPNATYMTGRQGIHLLIDIVAKGGNLLLNIAPTPEGTWQDGAYKLLSEYADWMKVNSQAIYNTRPLEPFKENNICLTQGKDGTTYFHYLAQEGEKMPESIIITSHQPTRDANVSMLGTNINLKWKKSGTGCIITIPDKIRSNHPCKNAWVIKVSAIE